MERECFFCGARLIKVEEGKMMEGAPGEFYKYILECPKCEDGGVLEPVENTPHLTTGTIHTNILRLADNVSDYAGFRFCYAEEVADLLRAVAVGNLREADKIAKRLREINQECFWPG